MARESRGLPRPSARRWRAPRAALAAGFRRQIRRIRRCRQPRTPPLPAGVALPALEPPPPLLVPAVDDVAPALPLPPPVPPVLDGAGAGSALQPTAATKTVNESMSRKRERLFELSDRHGCFM